MNGARLPRGRAGRLLLRHRLAVAEHGAELLEQKLQVLVTELAARRADLAEARQEWLALAVRAREWDERAGVMDGRRAAAGAAPAEPALARVRWQVLMGVRFPVAGECELPRRSPDEPAPAGAALAGAEAAHRAAVPAAVRAAVASAAVRVLSDAVDTTRHQVRVLRRYWIPLLGRTLDEVGSALEQADHEDAVRRSLWAGADRRPPAGGYGTTGAEDGRNRKE